MFLLVMITCRPSTYYQSLEKLLQLAPQPKYPNILFKGKNKGQSFLITHYVDSRSLIDCEKSSLDDCCDDDDDDDNFDEIFELSNPLNEERGFSAAVNVSDDTKDIGCEDICGPWPTGHQKFLNSTIASENLCFEIATGLPSKYHQPEWIPCASASAFTDDANLNVDRGSIRPGPGVLLPGSLRENGDFCILHLSLVQQQNSNGSNGSSYPQHQYGWEVQNVEFHTANKF